MRVGVVVVVCLHSVCFTRFCQASAMGIFCGHFWGIFKGERDKLVSKLTLGIFKLTGGKGALKGFLLYLLRFTWAFLPIRTDGQVLCRQLLVRLHRVAVDGPLRRS